MNIMGSRILEINVISAEVVKGVNLFTPMTDSYVVVSVKGDHPSCRVTPLGNVRGSCCYWNHTLRFICGAAVRSIVFQFKSKLWLEDVGIATVEIPITRDMFSDGYGNMRAGRSLVTDFRDGEVEGVLNFSCKFRDGYRNLAPPSVTTYPLAYPPPPYTVGYLYPPQPRCGCPWFGYRQPPFQGYGYEFAGEFMGGYDFEDNHGEYFGCDFEGCFDDFSGDDFEDYVENYNAEYFGYDFEDYVEEDYFDDSFEDNFADYLENYEGGFADDFEDYSDSGYDFCF